MSLWGMTVTTPHTQDTGCSRSRLWCAFPTDTIVHSTWTSSKIVACSWLVSVVRCFWSSSLVLDEFIPVGREKRTKGKFSVELPPSHTHPPTSGCGHRQQNGNTVKCWTSNLRLLLNSQNNSTRVRSIPVSHSGRQGHRVYKPASPPICALPRVQFAPITYLVVKYHRQSKHFLQKWRALLTTWEHENTFLMKSKRYWVETILPWILRAAPSHSNWRLTQLLSHAQQSEDQLVSSAKDSEEHLQMTTQKPSTH